MNPKSRHTPCLLLALLLAVSACGNTVDPGYEGDPLVTLEGQMSVGPDTTLDGPVRLALAWYPRMLADDSLAPPTQPKALVTEDIVYESNFPVGYRFNIYRPPPAEALAPLGGGFQGRGSLGILLAYRDRNDNARLDTIPATGMPIDRVVGSSLVWTASPVWMLIYLDSEQQAGSGFRKGFNLLKLTDANTSTVVPLTTRIPLALSMGGVLFDALVCEAAWDNTAAEAPCGLDLDGEEPVPGELISEGSVTIHGNEARVDLLVSHDELYVTDAQVTLGGEPIPYNPDGAAYRLTLLDEPLLTEGGTVELRIVSRGKEVRRTLSIPGGFDILTPAPETVVKSGAPLEIRVTESAGAQAYNLMVETGDTGPLAYASSNLPEYTFESVVHTGPATLRAEAVIWPSDIGTLGWLDVKVVRELPLTFEP